MATKKNITYKASLVGALTLVSRFFALFREILMTSFLGANANSDGFFTALKIPNGLRKIFAEGALSTAFVPTAVTLIHVNGKERINSVMTMAFLTFESLVLMVCFLVMWFAESVLWIIAGGFTPEQIAIAAPWLRILMPFIFFVSSSALLAGALQSIDAFFVPAFAPILLNMVLIVGLVVCHWYHLSVHWLCWFFLFGGFIQLVWHLIAYWQAGFRFHPIGREDVMILGTVAKKFFMSLIGSSIEEVNFFISTTFASYLAPGSLSLLRYANQFINIPLGVFVTAFSTVLLPHFSRVSIYAPNRLSFYLLESLKLIVWVMIPVTVGMTFFSTTIFSSLFVSSKFSLADAQQAGYILCLLLPGLVCVSINKIMRNVYFSLHETRIPAIIAIVATGIEIGFSWYFLDSLKLSGLALAITISHGVQTILFTSSLHFLFHFNLYLIVLMKFFMNALLQCACFGTLFWIMYTGICYAIMTYVPILVPWCINSWGLWLWVGPLWVLVWYLMYYSNRFFGIKIYFIGHTKRDVSLQ